MSQAQLHRHVGGLGVAVPTLRDEFGSIDQDAHAALARFLERSSVQTVLVAGTTGRGSMLSFHERLELAVCHKAAAPSTDIVVGAPPAISSAQMHELSAFAKAVLVAFPQVWQTEEILGFADRAARANISLIAYHHPSAHPPLDPRHWQALADAHIQVKNSDPDPLVLQHMLETGLSVLVGSSRCLLNAHSASGTISGMGSIHPDLVAACMEGDLDAHATLMHEEALHAHDRIEYVERTARAIVRSAGIA
jgi:dihydrodipicolinate synthase/N-acetylneuraminate lyase